MTTVDDLSYDPWDRTLFRDPYPTFRRMREEAPAYYNAEHDFWAFTRYDDVKEAAGDWQTWSSSKGAIIELIKADPPVHDLHRGLLAKVFTPRRVKELEPQIRDYCRSILGPLRGESRIDLVQQFGAVMPMKVIGMLLGIPEKDHEAVREHVDGNLLFGEDGKLDFESRDNVMGGTELYEEYIDWRAKNPSDDLMTELLNAQFTDEKGVRRTLTREEVLTYVSVLAGAGNETTTKLIGWMGLLLAKHPDQRAQVVADRNLVTQTVMETLRYEPPGPALARYLTRDIERHGQQIPAGSVALLIMASANRDERKYPNGDDFDIHRKDVDLLTFGYGVHFCLGQNLAKLEGRVALEEILDHFPEWDVDESGAELQASATVRGWDKLPIVLK
jgi:cytochrome P450